MSTSEGWDQFIEPVLLDEAPYCDPNPPNGVPTNCGSATVGNKLNDNKHTSLRFTH